MTKTQLNALVALLVQRWPFPEDEDGVAAARDYALRLKLRVGNWTKERLTAVVDAVEQLVDDKLRGKARPSVQTIVDVALAKLPARSRADDAAKYFDSPSNVALRRRHAAQLTDDERQDRRTPEDWESIARGLALHERAGRTIMARACRAVLDRHPDGRAALQRLERGELPPREPFASGAIGSDLGAALDPDDEQEIAAAERAAIQEERPDYDELRRLAEEEA